MEAADDDDDDDECIGIPLVVDCVAKYSDIFNTAGVLRPSFGGAYPLPGCP